ncbi:MAG: hypothetical protein LBC74_03395 [Planctomycetaceae bacterium]|jgi:L-arabinose isomerase|nr:hypothetical protein [Planctomycetaceae bacterium]
MIKEMKENNVKIGLFGIGLDTYWQQFEGLRERLIGYQNVIANKLALSGTEIVNAGLVDNPISATDAAKKFKQEDVGLIFLYVSTYALSSTVLPVVQKTNVPVVVLNLQPVKAINYAEFNSLGDRTKMTGEWLAHCQACSVPEIANVFLRSGIKFHQITGTLHDDAVAWNEINSWVRAAQVAQVIRSSRVGLLGHYYNGMLDIYSNLTRLSAQFGVHFEILEMCELKDNLAKVLSEDLDNKICEIYDLFDVQQDCPEEEIRRAARTSVALDKLVESHGLGAMAYFYNGTGDESYVDLIASVIVGNSILTSAGIPVAGEYEVKNVLAMKILDSFGAGGSFTEFYAMDFNDDVVLMGHDGPGHTTIAQGKTKLKPLKVFHGKVGQGLSVEMSVRHGAVTLLSVIDAPDGNIAFLIAEGESVPGQILEIGNTNSRYKFSTGARGFIDAWCSYGPAHHCAIGIGHIAAELEKLACLLGISAIRVC